MQRGIRQARFHAVGRVMRMCLFRNDKQWSLEDECNLVLCALGAPGRVTRADACGGVRAC